MQEITCFDKDGSSISRFTQWDCNREIYIEWEHEEVPSFQFGNSNSTRLHVVSGEIIEENGIRMARAKVPNILLQECLPLLCFVFLEEFSDEYYIGQAIYMCRIHIYKKQKPEDYEYIENIEYVSWVALKEEMGTVLSKIDECTGYITVSMTEIERAKTDSQDAAIRAVQSATDARTSADKAETHEDNMNTLLEESSSLLEALWDYENRIQQLESYFDENKNMTTTGNVKANAFFISNEVNISYDSEIQGVVIEFNS